MSSSMECPILLDTLRHPFRKPGTCRSVARHLLFDTLSRHQPHQDDAGTMHVLHVGCPFFPGCRIDTSLLTIPARDPLPPSPSYAVYHVP